jgi:hypothetical protein
MQENNYIKYSHYQQLLCALVIIILVNFDSIWQKNAVTHVPLNLLPRIILKYFMPHPVHFYTGRHKTTGGIQNPVGVLMYSI